MPESEFVLTVIGSSCWAILYRWLPLSITMPIGAPSMSPTTGPSRVIFVPTTPVVPPVAPSLAE